MIIIIIIIIIHYIYITLFSALKALYIERGIFSTTSKCAASTWMMRRQPYCARRLTTHQLTGGEETVMKPICMYIWGWIGGHDGQGPLGKLLSDFPLQQNQPLSKSCNCFLPPGDWPSDFSPATSDHIFINTFLEWLTLALKEKNDI